MLSDKIDRKFIETFDIDEWEVKTDSGWSDIKRIGKTIKYEKWVIKTQNGFDLECADDHIIFDENMEEVFVKNVIVDETIILTKNGPSLVTYLEKTDILENMYDIEIDDENHRFYSNGILSHNSMWLNNIAVNIANQGKNVVFVTLEMASHKCMKRMGSMRLKIPIDEYDDKSKDSIYMKNKLNQMKSNNSMFDEKPGKIFVKKFPTGSLTITELDNYITKLEQTKKIKIDAVLVDYINIMGLEKGLDFSNMLFLKGKHLAEGLRYIADKQNVAMITATQTDKSVWGGSDISLRDIPESKAIAETADAVWAIIRNSEMKRQNLYRLKVLKLRDGEYSDEQIRFDFNTNFLSIENDEFVGTK